MAARRCVRQPGVTTKDEGRVMRNPVTTLSAMLLLISAAPAFAQSDPPPATEQVIVDDGVKHEMTEEQFEALVQAELAKAKISDGRGGWKTYDELPPEYQKMLREYAEKAVREHGVGAGESDAQQASGLNVNVGGTPPTLKLEGLLQAPEGASVKWEDLKGQAVVVEFWGTWCKPCVRMIPHMNELAEDFKDEKVRFVSITYEDEKKITPFLERTPMKTWIGLDTDRDTINAFGVRAWPTTVLIDAKGVIRTITHPNNIDQQTIKDLIAGDIPRLRDPNAAAGAH